MENCLEDADDDMEQNPYHCLLKFSSITEIYNNLLSSAIIKKPVIAPSGTIGKLT